MINLLQAVPGGVTVETTSHRGFTPEEVASRCVNRIIKVSEGAHPAIREQAEAFKSHIEKIVLFYMKEAIASDRVTLENALSASGNHDIAKLIRSL